MLVLRTPFNWLCIPLRGDTLTVWQQGPKDFRIPIRAPPESVIAEITLFKTLHACVRQYSVLKSPPFKKEKCRKNSEMGWSDGQNPQGSLGRIQLCFAVLQQEQQREHKLTHHSFTKSCTIITDDILLDG